jgi:restriction system protein
MPIPDYQTLMRPLLEYAADQSEHTLREARDDLVVRLKLSPDETATLLPSGRQPIFDNRLGWARTYLSKAGLFEALGHGKFRITARGLEALKTGPQRIDAKFLRQFPEFIAFTGMTRTAEPKDTPEKSESQTPEELLESSHHTLKQKLADDLLERIKKCPPKFFEDLVIDVLVAIGYGGSHKDAAQAVGHTGDGGIDGIIKEDRLGLEAIFIQAKRWDGSVGRPIVQAFAGSLDGQRARKGVFITTSQFTADAKDYVSRIEKKIVLIDGDALAQLMIENGIGVVDVAHYDIKRIDLDYFEES